MLEVPSIKAIASLHDGERRLRVYAECVEAYTNFKGHGPSKNSQLADFLRSRYPKMYGKSVDLDEGKKIKTPLRNVFNTLFPRIGCSNCGIKNDRIGPYQLFCCRDCANLHRCGYTHPHKSPEIRDRFYKTMIARHGVMNALEKKEFVTQSRKTCREHFGVDSPQRSTIVRRKTGKTNLERYQSSNPMGNPRVASKARATYFHRTGYTSPAQNPKVLDQMRESTMKKFGVPNASQSSVVKSKKEATSLRNYGVTHPMKDPAVFASSMRNMFRIKTYTYLGRSFDAQSTYEAVVFEILADKYGIDNILTQFDVGFPEQAFSEMGTHPDLYVESKDLFIEVKSKWTLTRNPETLRANRRKARKADESGNKLRWVVLMDPKSREYILLPRRWYRWKATTLVNKLLDEDRL